MYLLDTCIVIPLFKGRFQLQEKACAVGLENCFLSDLVIAEMLVGVYKTKHSWDIIFMADGSLPVKPYIRFRKEYTDLPITSSP